MASAGYRSGRSGAFARGSRNIPEDGEIAAGISGIVRLSDLHAGGRSCRALSDPAAVFEFASDGPDHCQFAGRTVHTSCRSDLVDHRYGFGWRVFRDLLLDVPGQG